MIRLTAAAASPRGASRQAKPAVGPIDLAIERGSRHLILGANGAGKTTLLRLLAGLLPARSGSVAWSWLETPAEGATLWPHLAALFETPDAQFLADTVRSDVAFGLEGLGLPAAEIRSRVEETLDSFGMSGFAARDPRTLSAGEKARALLAAALAARPTCLLLDQTLAHLDPGSRRALEGRLARDAESGAFGLVRTHQEAEAPFPGERLHVLERCLLGDVNELSAEGVLSSRALPLPLALRLSAALARRGAWRGPLASDTPELLAELAAVPIGPADGAASGPGNPAASRGSRRRAAPREAAFSLQAVSWKPAGSSAGTPPIFELFDFAGSRGEIVAVVGRSGSGKSSLLRLLGGLETPREGVAWRAESVGEKSLASALALEYPERQLIGRTVLEDVGMALWVRGTKRAEREQMAVRAMSAVGLSHERFAARVPATLSEGEKRRVALAGLLAEPARLLLFDEPTAGLDPEGRRTLRETLDALRARERTLVLASHDLDFVHAVADRVVLLARDEGGSARVVGDGPPEVIFRDAAALAEAGIPAPDVVILEDALRAAGLLGVRLDAARDADGLVDLVEQGERRGGAPSGDAAASSPSRRIADVGAGAA